MDGQIKEYIAYIEGYLKMDIVYGEHIQKGCYLAFPSRTENGGYFPEFIECESDQEMESFLSKVHSILKYAHAQNIGL